MQHPHPRKIKSFVRRAGRITPSQTRALRELWPAYGIEYSPEPLPFDELFGRAAPLVLEVGFGNGDTLVEQAANDPGRDYLGIEVHEPGVGHCLLAAAAGAVQNLRLMQHDAIEVLRHCIGDSALSRINLYFPDPWPKKRHHKRRIVQQEFLDLAARKLDATGELFIATDWANYAEHIDEAIAASEDFTVAERVEHDGDSPLDRPTTKFERRGFRKGHRIWDWRIQRR